MTKLKAIYKCEICGNVVEVLHTGQGELVCCGQPMNFENEQINGEGEEKHLPEVLESENNFVVNIPHPMEENHFIEWVELVYENGNSCRKFLDLSSGEAKVEFAKCCTATKVRAYCNIHGLWVKVGV